MPVFATRGITLTWDSGEFDCPACGAPQVFLHKYVRRFLTVCKVPLIPLERVSEYVECQQCGHQFANDVLGDDPRPRLLLKRSEFARHVAWLMILTATRDRPLSAGIITEIQDVCEKLSGEAMESQEIEREVELARQSTVSPTDYIQRFIEVFEESGHDEIAIKAAFRVLTHDGPLTPEGCATLWSMAETLKMERDRFDNLIAEPGSLM